MRINKTARTIVDSEPAPDRNDEYRFYQALLGIWPHADRPTEDLVPRLQAYMTKAVKEAKRHSSWINPNEQYEQAVTSFVERVIAGPEADRFLPAFLPFQRRVARCGLVNSLSQTLLKIASPGVPDFYQGTELWDFSLVDPDNRRPVDFLRREQMLDNVDAVLRLAADDRRKALGRLIAKRESGGLKLLVTAAGLRLRNEMPDVFLEGDYLPLEVDSSVEGRAIAFARLSREGRAVIAIAPHLVEGLLSEEHPMPTGEMWRTSRVLLPPSLAPLTLVDALTGAAVKPVTAASASWLFVGQCFDVLPVALLVAGR
jgi:(1->4)-alpha-D-glucan 1-alpha-D-glucosylmutase